MAEKKPSWELKPEEVVALIDPNLKLKDEELGSTNIYLVEYKDDLAILKAGFLEDEQPPCQNRKWPLAHLKKEKKALEHLANIPGIPQLYKSYRRDNSNGHIYTAVLKQWINGLPEDYYKSKHGFNSKFQTNMEELIRNICERGVFLQYNVSEFMHDNVIVQDNAQPFFIDLGYARVIPKEKRSLSEKALKTQYQTFRERYFQDI